MKRIRPDDDIAPPLKPAWRNPVLRSSTTLGAREDAACCLRCPDEPCVRFSADESGGGTTIPVCPTDAIHGARSAEGPSISEACIACGLCVIRCPVGALHLTDEGVRVVAPDESHTEPATSDAEFAQGRFDAGAIVEWTEDEWEESIRSLSEAAAARGQNAFYPLVAHLFTAAGHPAWRPARGDTSNRIDLILANDEDSLPVEIKSGGETPIINVKSVQQALENRVVLDQRTFFPADPASATLVVGVAYPPTRSDVTELVADIAAAFDVNIGLVSLDALYGLASRRVLADVEVPRAQLSRLRGPLT